MKFARTFARTNGEVRPKFGDPVPSRTVVNRGSRLSKTFRVAKRPEVNHGFRLSLSGRGHSRAQAGRALKSQSVIAGGAGK